MLVSQFNFSKSSNGISGWGLGPSPGKEYLLTQNADVALQIPPGVNEVRLTYSGGATVKIQLGVISLDNSMAVNDAGKDTVGGFNIPTMPVRQFDTAGNQQYLHLLSPNTTDYVTVTFYNNGF